MDIESVSNLLSSPQKVVIVTHTAPDGDAIGSSLGLYHFLGAFGHTVRVILPTELPEYLQFLPHSETALVYEKEPNECTMLLEEAEILFVLDFNSATRAKGMEQLLPNLKAVKIMIDHHLLPEIKVDYALWDTQACSTAELVYRFIERLGHKKQINHAVASCLYTGICSDTGRFKYNINPDALMIAAFLMERGASAEKINDALFDNFSEQRLRLLGYCLTEKLQVFGQYCTAIIALSSTELAQFNYKPGDLEGIVNYPLSLANVRFSVLIKEDNKDVRLSFRSKGDFAVNELASEHFSGGGHKNAAGGNSKLSLADTVQKLIRLLPAYERDLSAAALLISEPY
ncbi:MAG TPA: bifunctional oligoribonuclease/PAP phosphatase NrnA, partial [Chitinophagales bacterium]|nr:bifunctional oligoribonuclease/PAP phosphatase NrnA [Chitinophagales bacterium]